MRRHADRLERVALSLTPRQAICRWLTEAHGHGSLVAYAQSLPRASPAAHPLNGLAEQVEAAVRAALRGRPEEEAQAAVRQAVADTGFLYFLHHRLNVRVLEALPHLAGRLALLLEQAQGVARDDLARLRLGSVAHDVAETLPYPLTETDAAAVTAALGGWVEPWDELLEEDGAVAEWVGAAYVAEGRVVLPWGAYGALPGTPSPLPEGERGAGADGLRALFAHEGAWADFQARRDYRQGFADVRDAELAARVAAVGVALRTDVGRLQQLVAHVSGQRYGGQPVLYPDLAEQLGALAGAQRDAERLLRAVVACGVASTEARPEEVTREARDVGGRDEEMLARAGALWLIGGQEDAQALVARVLAE